jgi:FPC/CPF motif-containing protein YcgG
MTEQQLSSLKEAYAEVILDGMDHKTLEQFAFDCIMENVAGMNEADLIAELGNYTDPETVEDLIKSVTDD